MQLAIFGGMFDPPHLGHLLLAERTLEALQVEKMLFIPTAAHPMKSQAGHSEAKHRLEMIQLAIKDNPRFAVSDLEIKREGISYTVDTLEELHKTFSPEKLFLCLGGDNAASFHTWHKPERILELCSIVVWRRSNDETLSPLLTNRANILNTPIIDISSTTIRERVREGKSIRYLVSEEIREYITNNNLYC